MYEQGEGRRCTCRQLSLWLLLVTLLQLWMANDNYFLRPLYREYNYKVCASSAARRPLRPDHLGRKYGRAAVHVSGGRGSVAVEVHRLREIVASGVEWRQQPAASGEHAGVVAADI